MKMKIKRFNVERIHVKIEYIRQIAGRLYMLFNFHRLIKFVKFQPVLMNNTCCSPLYRLYIPKIEVKRNEES